MNCYQRTGARSTPGSFSLTAIALTMLTCLLLTSVRVFGADTGSIQGRIFNASLGRYLENARVTVEGTNLEAFTNQAGEYTLENVPVGVARLKVEYTGQEPLITPVTVQANTAASQDVTFNPQQAQTSNDGTIMLNEYVVAAERFKNARQIAINEERYSTNIKNVVSTDSFGYVHGNNLGEFVKFLPGVETQYGDADAFSGAGIGGINQASASSVSVRGFGAADTGITIDGMPISGISPGSLSRAVGLDMISVNNASRVEVIKVATPDMPNESAGGTVNLVTKSAFEYSKPTYTANINLTMNTEETEIFKKTPGPANKKTFHTLPSGSLSVAVPLTKTLGFSVSIASFNNFAPNDQASLTWQNTTTNAYSRIPTGATTTAVINAAGQTPSLVNPMLRQLSLYDNPWVDYKKSGAFKVDWRPFPSLTVSTNYTASTYDGDNVNRRLQFAAAQPKDWSTTYTLGRPFEAAAGTLAQLNPGNSGTLEITARDKVGFTHSGYIKVGFRKGPWAIDGSVSLSSAYNEQMDTKHGHFSRIELSLNNVGYVNFLDIKDGVPGTIQAFDRAGAPIDYTKLSTWTVANAATLTTGLQKQIQKDKDRNYTLDVRRDLDFLPFKMSLKIGGTHREKEVVKYGNGTGYNTRYVGPALTVSDVLDTGYQKTPAEAFGFRTATQVEWADLYKMYDIYEAHPEYFNENFDVALMISNYGSRIGQTKAVKETRDSGYVMVDGSFFNNRLSYFAGVRQSKTKVEGFQPFTDPKWNFAKNPDGTLYRDSVYTQGANFSLANQPGVVVNGVITTVPAFNLFNDTALIARLKAKGATYSDHLILGPNGIAGVTGNNLEARMLNFYTREVNTERTDEPTPRVGLSYKITDKLVIKPSWSREVQLPPLDSGRNGILGTYNIDENQTTNIITINTSNPSLKPKTISSYNLQVAYYTASGGSISGTYYYKDIKNNWEDISVLEGSPEFVEILDALGLDPAPYLGRGTIITSTVNGDAAAKQTGYELSVSHGLGFLGKWGSSIDVFANYTHKKATNSVKPGVIQLFNSANAFWSAGVQYSGSRLSLSARMTYRDEVFGTATNIAYNPNNVTPAPQIATYSVTPELYKLDLEGSYQISKRYSVFISGKDVLNSERKTTRRDAAGLLPSEQVTSNYQFGIQITAGVNAKF